jgi:PIN domain nuclease of toxin-antitoxin system
VNLLLDTHAFLWWDAGSLAKRVVDRIRSADRVFVSAASAWEVAIKEALGKITVRATFSEAIADYGFDELPVRMVHTEAVRALPPHHRDPFDRMLVAQASVEQLTLVSRDPLLAAYAVSVVWD